MNVSEAKSVQVSAISGDGPELCISEVIVKNEFISVTVIDASLATFVFTIRKREADWV